ncbi:MAG TPA: 3',5'-cyclic-nucleotide phosphodiesterase [Pyrinomonadaceae bacterium]
MKLQLLPSTFEPGGAASARQHLTCLVIDDAVTVDAGSLAMAASSVQQRRIRDIVLTHAHLDHIAGLPLFIDDLFSTLTEPITVHATQPVIDTLERDVFNWSVYPRFSELTNGNGPVLKYRVFDSSEKFLVRHLTFHSVEVNHKVPSTGFVISDASCTIGFSGDTAESDAFWALTNSYESLSAILIECAFPDELEDLAQASHHLTPRRLKRELAKSRLGEDCPVYIINIKPMFRDRIMSQLAELGLSNLKVLEVGKIYDWVNHESRAI